MQRLCRSTALVASLMSGVSRFMGTSSMTRNVQMVATTLADDDVEERMGAVKGNEERKFGNTEGSSLGDAEQFVFEMGEKEMQALPKTFRGSVQKKSCMSPEECQKLTQMIFETHYAAEAAGRGDRAMWYQSALELHWLEDWANDTFGVEGKDEVRRAVKKAVLQRVDLHKPLAYIIGHQPFYGCKIRCSPPLLCPRPETEMWTHWLVRHHLSRVAGTKCAKREPIRVLDMCCGTGCIGIAIARHVPHAEVLALDIMDEAVKTSEENARLNGLDSRCYRAIKSDMFDAFLERNSSSDDGDHPCNALRGSDTDGSGANGESKNVQCEKASLDKTHIGSFDVIVSNPPYVLPDQYVDLPVSIRMWESKLALVGDARREKQQYLYFQELCELGAALLKPKAQRDCNLINAPNFVVEVGIQAEHVASLMERSKMWGNVEIHLDYAKQLRWISASSSH